MAPIPERIVFVTDSITINSIWYRCSSDYFLPANEQTADVVANAGVIALCSAFLAFRSVRVLPSCQSALPARHGEFCRCKRRPGFGRQPHALAGRVPNTHLTVTVGRDEKLQRKVELIRDASAQKFTIIGWTTELPQLLASHHILVSKAGGATVQE